MSLPAGIPEVFILETWNLEIQNMVRFAMQHPRGSTPSPSAVLGDAGPIVKVILAEDLCVQQESKTAGRICTRSCHWVYTRVETHEAQLQVGTHSPPTLRA